MQDFCKTVGIKYVRVPAYHPQGNSVVERLNGSLKNYLFKMTHERNWSALDLASCAFAYNTSVHSSLKETPHFLLFNADPVIEASILYDRNDRFDNTSKNESAMEMIVNCWCLGKNHRSLVDFGFLFHARK